MQWPHLLAVLQAWQVQEPLLLVALRVAAVAVMLQQMLRFRHRKAYVRLCQNAP